MDLTGKVALITGGASGIGAATARLFAGAGAHVAVADVDADRAGAVAQEIGGIALPGDATDPDVMPAAVAAAEKEFGRLDIAYLNAGIVAKQSGLGDLDLADYRRIFGVNVDHVVFGTAAAVPALKRAGGGRVIATASLAGLTAMPGDPLYTATKHAVVGYVRAAAPVLLGDNIVINAVCPGFVDTPLIAGAVDKFRAAQFPLLLAEDIAAAVGAIVERGEPGECWFVQPGREPAPYGFRGVPSPVGVGRPPSISWEDGG